MTAPPSEQWIQQTNNRGRPTQDSNNKDFKHAKPSEHWLNPTITSNRFTAIQPDEEPKKPPLPGKETTPKPLPIYISNVTTVPPLIQLVDQIVPQHYEIKALTNNQV
jgi:hypothetical protein